MKRMQRKQPKVQPVTKTHISGATLSDIQAAYLIGTMIGIAASIVVMGIVYLVI